MKSKVVNTLLLFLAAMIWGSTFVAQSVGVEYVQPFTFTGIRSVLGGTALLPVIALLDRRRPPEERRALLPLRSDRTLLRGGIVCGLCLFAGSNLQQYGIQFTTAGKCGFITSFYVALVPILSMLLLRRRYGWQTWVGVAVALAGLYLLCIREDFSVGQGDIYVLACAVAFAFHILAIDHFTARVDGVRLSCLQFLVCGTASLICTALFEQPRLPLILKAWLPLAYSGLLSCAVAYTLQILCQKHVEPALASLVLSLESVFSALAGWALLHETLSGRELFGCLLTFGAVVLVELAPAPAQKKSGAV